MPSPRLTSVLSVLCLCVAPACVEDATSPAGGGGASGGGDGGGGVTGPLLPWTEGNNWTYDVTVNGAVTRKVTTIGPEETVGGTGPHAADVAHKVTTSKKDGADESVSWQTKEGDLIVRYRELAFDAAGGNVTLDEHWDPHKLHVDSSPAHTVKGATWLEEYQETKLPANGSPSTATARDSWTVEGVGQTVTVPAGTFDTAIVLVKSGGTSQKKYWYVAGVGKVKETGTQTEELVSYEVAP